MLACLAVLVAGAVALSFLHDGSAKPTPKGSAARLDHTPAPAPLTLGSIGERKPVGPPAGHALAGLNRDAGISAVLGDGSVVWMFGDTIQRSADGELLFFVIGTGAWASAENPTMTLDHVLRNEATPVAVPTASFPDCPPHAPNPGMWPASAVVVPTGGRDRVIVWLGNVCLGDGGVLVPMGVAVAEWWYDPGENHTGSRIELTVLEQNLFPLDADRKSVV